MEKKINIKKTKNKLQIFIDPIGNTLNLWWDDPKKSRSAYESEKSWDVIALDKEGRAIGLEKIGFFPNEIDPIKNIKQTKKLLLKNNFLFVL